MLGLTVLLQTPPAPPAQTPAAVLADARAKMTANDLDGAAKVLETFLAANPGSFRALNLLGTVRQQQKQYDAAIDAFTRSHAADTTRANLTPLYNIAVNWALKGDADRAFEWLEKAKKDGRIDLSFAAVDPNMASIRKDARLASLLPKPETFSRPFVEDVTVLREWRGEGANDNFGWIARNIGDVDADGVNDVVTSSPSYARSAPPASPGRIYVYSTKRNQLLWSADGADRDSLGVGIEAAGDTNRDGIPDVVASAPGGGYARIYSGRDGKVLQTLRAENRSDGFGRHASGAGDVNRDGYADVIIGAPNNNGGGQGAGRAYVYSGKDGSLLLTLTGERAGDAFGSAVTGGSAGGGGFVLMVGAPGAGPRQTGRVYVYDTLEGKPKFVLDSDETGVAFGAMFVALPGDVNRDGVGDLYVSDWVNAAKGPQTGRVYAFSGKDGARLHALTGDAAGDGFGTTQAIAGDVDADGHADLLVGAWQYSGAAPSGGRVTLHSGKDGRVMRTFTCRTPFDTFGFDAVTIGDVNGDGASDFLITSGYSAVNGYHSGRVFIVSGK
ncbi:MAG TPA: FG-GAP-like repeat-containing protein [Vicinamibacterales bacterium]|nr:FG-GAP-like repeat-containing protein [Vicinamibacterales bacterium]